MKTLFVSLVVLLFAFFIGCQNSITDPVSETTNMTATVEDETVAYKDAVSLWPGVIKLDENICEPIHNTCNTTLIAGVIKYDIKPIRAGHHLVTALKVGIYINAELKSGFNDSDGPWRVFGMTEDYVYLSTSNQEVYTLNKEFFVRNTGNYRLILALRFEVHEKVVKLVSMELRNYYTVFPIGDPQW
jgi:hypothetical protein